MKTHLGHSQEFLGIVDLVIGPAKLCMALDECTHPYSIINIIAIQKLDAFNDPFVQVDDIVQQFFIFDDPELSTAF